MGEELRNVYTKCIRQHVQTLGLRESFAAFVEADLALGDVGQSSESSLRQPAGDSDGPQTYTEAGFYGHVAAQGTQTNTK